jgi:signal transduction histidine kinase/CheY-like chemotaxis protein
MADMKKDFAAKAEPVQQARSNRWLPVFFVGFLVCNWMLVTLLNMLNLGGYVTGLTSSLGWAVGTVSLILVGLISIRVSARDVPVVGLWPSLYVAAGLVIFARSVYFIVYPHGGWEGIWPALSKDAERYIEDVMVYAAEIILVAGFVRVMFALRLNVKDLRVEQRRLHEEQAVSKQAQEHSQRLEKQLFQAQKMESIGRLAGGVAHDFNNMLTPILAYAGMLESNLELDEQSSKKLREIGSAAGCARNLMQQLLAFASRQALEMKSLDLNDLIAGFDKMIRSLLRENIKLRIDLSSRGRFLGDPGQIEQVIMNLVLNAQDAMPHGGTLVIETGDVMLDEAYAFGHEGVTPGPHILLQVSDTGQGLDKDACDKIFEPFFTTKMLGRGVGLGLSTTHGIVKQHRGNIGVYSEPKSGTIFKIYLPRTDAPEVPATSRVAPMTPVQGSGMILVAEDNEQVRTVSGMILRNCGYGVLEAVDGRMAIEIAEQHAGKIGLLVSDVVMPDMNGKILYNRLAEKWPNLKVLYMSGYSENVIAHHGVLEPGIHFIQKPFTADAFIHIVQEVLG